MWWALIISTSSFQLVWNLQCQQHKLTSKNCHCVGNKTSLLKLAKEINSTVKSTKVLIGNSVCKNEALLWLSSWNKTIQISCEPFLSAAKSFYNQNWTLIFIWRQSSQGYLSVVVGWLDYIQKVWRERSVKKRGLSLFQLQLQEARSG